MSIDDIQLPIVVLSFLQARTFQSQDLTSVSSKLMVHTASLKHSFNDTLVDCKSVFRDFFQEMFVSADPKIAHFFKTWIGVDKVAFRDKVAADLLLTGDGDGAH